MMKRIGREDMSFSSPKCLENCSTTLRICGASVLSPLACCIATIDDASGFTMHRFYVGDVYAKVGFPTKEDFWIPQLMLEHLTKRALNSRMRLCSFVSCRLVDFRSTDQMQLKVTSKSRVSAT